jgi:phosphoribosylformimino-5-aminoimidazole carboxamide ribotide isomerase
VNLYPAIDILGGHAVRLTRGDFDAKKTYDQDPLRAAQAFAEQGAQHLHVVDLDGAREGRPVNLEHLRRIADELDLPVQYGGGLRTADAVEQALDAGAERVILGTAIFSDPELPTRSIEAHGADRVLVSIDAREGYVATHGWMRATQVRAEEAIARWREGEQGVRRFVFTDIDHDGMLDGPDPETIERAARAAGEGKLILSGGIGELAHLRAIARLRRQERLESLDGVIVGKALYERRFTVGQALAALAG